MDNTEEGGYKIRCRMLIFADDGKAYAICPTCKNNVEVPVNLEATKVSRVEKIIINSKNAIAK
jgi:uncharacterized Zn finger protein (UPF0148 family)